MTGLLMGFVFLFGAIVGSFLNVCISRLPERRSLVYPFSHCPKCGKSIRYYDNIPLVSFMLLKGKCRACGEKISLRYPLVELITALFSLFLYWQTGLSWHYLFYFIFVCALIVITFIDLSHMIIPDVITLPGIPFFFLAAVFFLDITFLDALLGLVIGGGILFIVGFVYEILTKREGIGGGDVKLLAMIGAFLGWQSLLFVILVSSLIGALIGIAVIIIKGKDLKYALPFGPFLAVAAVAYIYWGKAVLHRIMVVM